MHVGRGPALLGRERSWSLKPIMPGLARRQEDAGVDRSLGDEMIVRDEHLPGSFGLGSAK